MMISVVSSLSDLGKIYCGDGKAAHFPTRLDGMPPTTIPKIRQTPGASMEVPL